MNDLSVLILSAGTRNKIVQFYRQILDGRGNVIACDCSAYAPALYDADKALIMPRITEPDYMEKVLEAHSVIWDACP